MAALALWLVCPQFAQAAKLQPGDSGAQVVALQKELKKKDMYGNEEITGFYGMVTEKAVIRFQEKNDMTADGIAGDKTLRKLFGNAYEDLFGDSTPSSSTSKATSSPSNSDSKLSRWLRPGSEGETVRTVQKALSNLGYYGEEITGFYGPTTETAVKLFQKVHNLEQDGVVGDETYALLTSGGQRKASIATTKASAPTAKPSAATPKPPERTQAPSRSLGSLDSADEIIEYARKFLGVPYVYGASGPDSFDCSGYTAYVMKKAGVHLPHSAKSQAYGSGDKISSRSDLRKGDLVFFDTLGDGTGISHVGIYIGDGDFIHAGSGASTGKQVKISTLSSGFYASNFRWGKRVM